MRRTPRSPLSKGNLAGGRGLYLYGGDTGTGGGRTWHQKTALVLVGDVITHGNYQKSRLYAADFTTEFRQAKCGAIRQRKRRRSGVKISVISFTETGQQLAERIRESMDGETAVTLYTKCPDWKKRRYRLDDSDADTICVRNSLSAWAGEQMAARHALIFIGACGIAVRAIAPGSWINCTTVRYWWQTRWGSM